MKTHLRPVALFATLLLAHLAVPLALAAPALEHAYVNGRTVTISVMDPFVGKAAPQAVKPYFEVFYPIGWEFLTTSVPQCNPCDHVGDGDDFSDYHDHVFSAEPSQPGRGGYSPLWQLNLIAPAYTGNAVHDLAVSVVYASFLPIKSAEGVAELLAATMPDGSPVAEQFVEDYVFLAAIVNENASH
jgi:hypothetical protein